MYNVLRRFSRVLYICGMSINELRKGQLLCSKPYIGDPFFERTVVLITEHNKHGTEGLIINQPIEIKNPEDIGFIGAFTQSFYRGGPVANNRCYYIHNQPHLLPESDPLTEDIHFGGNPEVLEQHLNSFAIDKSSIRFYIGISGWEPGQLQREIEENTWFIEDARPFSWVCGQNTEHLWYDIIKGKGHPYTMYAKGPINPDLN